MKHHSRSEGAVYGPVHQALADNSTGGGMSEYMGHDGSRISRQELANTRMNDYVTNEYAGPGSHKGPAKVKGQAEHSKDEDEYGNDYGV